jgi:hypothetical protein
MPFLHQRLGNPALTLISRRLFGSPAGDIYCGLRGFRRSAIERLELTSTGMEFAIEWDPAFFVFAVAALASVRRPWRPS